jgi:hypothetical protein
MTSVRFEPGTGVAQLRDIEFEEELERYSSNQLSNARKAAENWRTGLAGLIVLITTVSVVKGRQSIASLPTGGQIALGILAVGALFAALVGATMALRAAYGWLSIVSFERPDQLRESIFDEARNTRKYLIGAIITTYISVVLLASAVAVTWYV